MIFKLLIAALSTLINRFRGGGLWSDKIPVKALWIAAPLFGALPLLIAGITINGITWSLIFFIAYISWAIMPWGRWFDLGRMYGHLSEFREFTKYEQIVEDWALIINRGFRKIFKQDYSLRWFDRVALYIRHASMLVPGFILISLYMWNFYFLLGIFIFAFILLMCYEIGWILWDREATQYPIPIAEFLSGLVWGLLIILLV